MNRTKCICCNGEIKNSSYLDEFTSNQIGYCIECGHLQVIKIPTLAEIKSYYEGVYSTSRDEFVNQSYFDVMLKRAKAQHQYINKYINHQFKSALDIGAGYGYLLKELMSYISHIEGIEFDPLCIDYVKSNFNIDMMRVDSEDDILSGDECFDLVTMSHSLEHFLDIDSLMERIKQKAKYVFIEIPKYDRYMREEFVNQEGHINFFTLESLKKFILKHEFNIIDVDSYGPSMNIYWKVSYRRFANILRKFARGDWFFGKYARKNKNGIWVRALLEVRR